MQQCVGECLNFLPQELEESACPLVLSAQFVSARGVAHFIFLCWISSGSPVLGARVLRQCMPF